MDTPAPARGETKWYTSDKFKAVVYLLGVYLAMILGMAAKTLFQHLTEDTPLGWTQLVIPLLVSPMVYGVVFQVVKENNNTVLMLIFGFQNGFFWQDVFLGIKGD